MLQSPRTIATIAGLAAASLLLCAVLPLYLSRPAPRPERRVGCLYEGSTRRGGLTKAQLRALEARLNERLAPDELEVRVVLDPATRNSGLLRPGAQVDVIGWWTDTKRPGAWITAPVVQHVRVSRMSPHGSAAYLAMSTTEARAMTLASHRGEVRVALRDVRDEVVRDGEAKTWRDLLDAVDEPGVSWLGSAHRMPRALITIREQAPGLRVSFPLQHSALRAGDRVDALWTGYAPRLGEHTSVVVGRELPVVRVTPTTITLRLTGEEAARLLVSADRGALTFARRASSGTLQERRPGERGTLDTLRRLGVKEARERTTRTR